MHEKAKLLIVSLFFIFTFLLNFNPAYAWLSGFDYRRAINITNNGSTALTDYQVLITLNTQTLISQGKMRSDCGDIRFALANNTLLSYWIEGECNTASTRIWVRVPSIPADSNITIYLYYGNPNATSLSNGDATFDFFDDFLGTSLNTSKWNVTNQDTARNTYGVSNGYLWLKGNATVSSDGTWKSLWIRSSTTFTPSKKLVMGVRFYMGTSGGVQTFGFSNGVAQPDFADNDAIIHHWWGGTANPAIQIRHNGNALATSTLTVYARDTWHGWIRWEAIWNTTNILVYYGGVQRASSTSFTDAMPIHFGVARDPSSGATRWTEINIDYVAVAKYASPEPTVNVRAEEVNNQPPQITIYLPQNTTYFYLNNFIFNFSVSDDNYPIPHNSLTNGLVGWLTFDEGSGNIAYDSSGNMNNGNVYINMYNPNFEGGWNSSSNSPRFWSRGSLNWNLYLDSTTKVDGDYSLKVNTTHSPSAMAWSGIRSFPEIPVVSGSTYTFSTWMKCDNCNESHIVLEAFNLTSNSWYQIAQCPGGQRGTFDWRNWVCTVTVPTNVTRFRITLNAGPANATSGYSQTWFDNITLIGPNGSYSGWVDGKIGKALSFDGVDDYVMVTYSPSMNIQQAFTFAVWVYPTAGGLDWRNIVGQVGNDDGIFFMSGNYFMGSVWVVNSDGSRSRLGVSGTSKPLNNWYFVVFTGISGVGYRLYVNGVLEREVNDTRPHQNLTNNFYVGAFGWRNFFAGIIDDVRIYNRALSEDEIKALYLNTAPRYIKAFLDNNLVYQDTVYSNSTSVVLKLNLTQTKAYNFTVYANDTLSSSQQSVIFTIRDFEIQQIIYNVSVYETTQQNFIEVIRYNPDLIQNITATLVWNSTNYQTSRTQNSTHFTFSSNIYIPFVQTNNTQVSFYFSNQINYLNGTTITTNSQTNQQNILFAYIPTNLSVPTNVIEMDYIPVSFSPHYYSTSAELQAYVYFRNQTIQLTPRSYAYFTGSVDALNVTNYNETYPIYADLVITFNNQTITRTSNQTNITVYRVTLTDCSIFPTQTFQLIIRDEETTNNLTSLNYTFLRFDVTPLNNRITRTYTFENKQNICIYPAWATYNAKIYAIVRKDNYALTTHAPYTTSVLSNQTQTLTLYMLPSGYATPITFTLPDQNYILYVERGYGANFVYIRSDTADFNKKVVIYLRPYDIYYKVKVFTPEQTLCFQSDQFKIASSTYEILSCQVGLVNYTITPMYQKIISGNCSALDLGDYMRVLCSFVTLDNLDHDVNLTIYRLVEPFGEIVYYHNSTRASTGSFDVLLEKGHDYKVVMTAHSMFDYITFNIYSKILQKSAEVFTLALILFAVSAVVGFVNPFAGLVMNVLILFGLSATGVLTLQTGIVGALTLLIIVAIIFTREWR